jgi:hypothetical protein
MDVRPEELGTGNWELVTPEFSAVGERSASEEASLEGFWWSGQK